MSNVTNYEAPGLIKQNNSEYYTGEFTQAGSGTTTQTVNWPSTLTPLIWTDGSTQQAVDNYDVYIDNVLQYGQTPYSLTDSLATTLSNTNDPASTSQVLTITTAQAVAAGSLVMVKLKNTSIWDNYKNYQYVTLKDIVNNFMLAYVGTDMILTRAKRSDVIFHAKRGLQEFNYDTLRSVNIQELTIPANLSLPLPQDYVNYVQLAYTDDMGVRHIIYNTKLTVNPTAPLIQDDQGIPTQDQYGNNIESQQAIINDRWRNANQNNLTGQTATQEMTNASVYDWYWWKNVYGQRYGLQPENSQKNGWFTVDNRRGVFAFSGNLSGRLITLEYISDGLAYNVDSRVPKMAEDALYAHIMYSMIANRPAVPEYLVQRYKRDRSAKLRNAKIRLSNIKMEDFTQVMRGKSKWIKH